MTYFGPGCAGALGVPGIEPVGRSRPRLGSTLDVEVTNLATNLGGLFIGFSNTSSLFGALPFDLTAINMPGCLLRTDPLVAVSLLGTNNSAQFSLSMALSTSLAGARFYLQAISIDPPSNGFGAVMSDALAAQIGSF